MARQALALAAAQFSRESQLAAAIVVATTKVAVKALIANGRYGRSSGNLVVKL